MVIGIIVFLCGDVNRAPKQGRGRATTTKEAERRVVGVGMNETQVLMGDSIYRQASNTNRMRIHFIFNALVECSVSTKLKGIRKCNIITIHNQKIGTRKKERKKKSLVAKDVLMETRQMCCKPTNCSSCNFGCN